MEPTRSGQGRSDKQIERNHQVLQLFIRFIGIAMYFVFCYQIANYMINN